jgi:hypothetical protein
MRVVVLAERNPPAADAAPPLAKGGWGDFCSRVRHHSIEETCRNWGSGDRLTP